MSPITLPFISLLRRPVRTGLTILGVSAAVAGIISIQGLVNGLENAWVGGIENRGTSVVGVRKGAAELLGASFTDQVIQKFNHYPDIVAAAGELTNLEDIDSGIEFEPYMTIMTGWNRNQYLWQELEFQELSARNSESDNKIVMLGPQMAKRLNLTIDDDITIRNSVLRVAGIFRPKGVMMSNSIILPIQTVQELTGLDGRINFVNLRLKAEMNTQEVRKLLDSLASDFEQLRFTETSRLTDTISFFNIWKAMSWSASAIVLVMGIVIALNTLLMSVTERTWEIGVLSSIGWSDGQIFRHILFEGLLITFCGGVAGILVGVTGLYMLANVPFLAGFLSPDFSLVEIMKMIAFIVVLGIASSYYPAYRAIHIHPAKALRHH